MKKKKQKRNKVSSKMWVLLIEIALALMATAVKCGTTISINIDNIYIFVGLK